MITVHHEGKSVLGLKERDLEAGAETETMEE
jgi:ATP-dependent Clp protease adapter protein ClpS